MSLSMDNLVHTPPTASTRRGERVMGLHLFTIKGYSLEMNNEKGNFLESATFHVGGYDWLIRYYPNGNIFAEDDHTSIFLCLKSDVEYVKAQAGFRILNQNGNPLAPRKVTVVGTFKKMHSDWGYQNFVKRSAFESVLRDDCIVIKCGVCVFKASPVESVFPLHVPPSLYKQQLGHLLETGNGADTIFEVNGEIFNAHRCILAARSTVFEAQFFGLLKEKLGTIIKIEDMEAPVFKSLLHYIYSETIPEFEERNESETKHNMAQHLLVAADRYDLKRLKIMCENILFSSIDRSNVVSLLLLAERHNCIHLKTACLRFLASPEVIGQLVATGQLKLAP